MLPNTIHTDNEVPESNDADKIRAIICSIIESSTEEECKGILAIIERIVSR